MPSFMAGWERLREAQPRLESREPHFGLAPSPHVLEVPLVPSHDGTRQVTLPIVFRLAFAALSPPPDGAPEDPGPKHGRGIL